MLTTIGKTPTAPGTLDLLVECHDRIRTFLALARRIAEAGAVEREELRQAAGRVARYFGEALPLHARDEEQSIAPRLRGRDPAVDAELEEMTREHAGHEEARLALVGVCQSLAAAPERHAELAPGVRRAAEALEAHFAPHLRREEEVIFPAVRRWLDPAADAQVVREIRARRGVSTPAPDGAPGPIVKLLAAEHLVLDALLSGAVARPGEVDRRAFDDFRAGLLRHIAVEEKILLPAAREARGGEPLPEARRLRIEHGAIAALLVPTPTPELVEEIRKILYPHNVVEEQGGVYERCEALIGDRADEILHRIRTYPPVKVARYQDGPRVCRTAEEALELSAKQAVARE